jgi:hypothetical protein
MTGDRRRDLPSRAPRFHAGSSARPLSWGFAPFSGRQRKGSGFCLGTSTSPAVASSGFEPSRRLDPLHAFPNVSVQGRSWDCSLQGFSPPAGPRLVSERPLPSWHCLTCRSNASNRATGPTINRGSRVLVSGWVGCLQGLDPRGKPDHCTTGLGWVQRPLPSWFSSSLGSSPPSPPGDRRHPFRSRASFTTRALASPDRDRTTAFSQTWKWRVLSRECQPFRGFSLVPPASSKTTSR